MICRLSSCRALAGVLLAGLLAVTATAAKLVPLAPSPVLTTPMKSPVTPIVAPIELSPVMPEMDLDVLREAVYSHAKGLGAPSEELSEALDAITLAAQSGAISTDLIQDAALLAPDHESVVKIQSMLTGYAETVAYGEPLTADLSVEGMPLLPVWQPAKVGGFDAIDFGSSLPGPSDTPQIGGVCLTCPAVNAGPLTPIAAYQFQSGSLNNGADCAWYSFNVTVGRRYEFTTCSPGSAAFDTFLRIYNPLVSCTGVIAGNDDCAPPTIRQSTLFWDATFSGVAHLSLRHFSSGSSSAGAFTLAYRDQGIVCESCPTPGSTLANPTAACQCVTGFTDASCRSDVYRVFLIAGSSYRFTTCPAQCGSATATFDTKLFISDPSCVEVANNDDACTTTGQTTRSTLNFTATTTGFHAIRVSGFGVTAAVGNYTLCYLTTSAACGSCAAGPFTGPLTPTAVCQTDSDTVDACQDNWYQFVLTAGTTYEFTTCSIAGGCLTGNAGFDTVIEIANAGCAVQASDDDGCTAPRSKLLYTPTSSGTYRLRVRGAGGAQGSYTLTYRSIINLCVAPTVVTVVPTSGNTGTTNCSRTETFTTTSNGTFPTTFSWTITPPSSGSASPASGTIPNDSDGIASFVSTLTREGTYTVTVTSTNACGSRSQTISYTLRDLTPPTVTAPGSTTVSCSNVPPPATPTVRDNCDPAPVVTFTQVITPGSCPGNYTIVRTWVARDRSGNTSAPRVQVITVRDTTPPVIVPDNTQKYCVWPPNHELVCFSNTDFSPVITDNCSPPIIWRVVAVRHSEEGLEPCGDGNQDPDVIIAPGGSGFCIRAERCGQDPAQNDGRRYYVIATATDACGNTSAPTSIGYILVPHDNSDTDDCIYPTSN